MPEHPNRGSSFEDFLKEEVCWLLRISVPKMRVIDVSPRSLLRPSPYQAGGRKVSHTLFLSSF